MTSEDYDFSEKRKYSNTLNSLLIDVQALEEDLERFPDNSIFKGDARILLIELQHAPVEDGSELGIIFERYRALYGMLISLDNLRHISYSSDFSLIGKSATSAKRDLNQIYSDRRSYTNSEIVDLARHYESKAMAIFKEAWGKPLN